MKNKQEKSAWRQKAKKEQTIKQTNNQNKTKQTNKQKHRENKKEETGKNARKDEINMKQANKPLNNHSNNNHNTDNNNNDDDKNWPGTASVSMAIIVVTQTVIVALDEVVQVLTVISVP